jgi:hypothetical protein
MFKRNRHARSLRRRGVQRMMRRHGPRLKIHLHQVRQCLLASQLTTSHWIFPKQSIFIHIHTTTMFITVKTNFWTDMINSFLYYRPIYFQFFKVSSNNNFQPSHLILPEAMTINFHCLHFNVSYKN